MAQQWKRSLKSSRKPRSQRLYRIKAPMHITGHNLNAHLSKELREKLKTRSLRVRKGDTVKIISGQFKGKSGTVERVIPGNAKIFIGGVELVKKNGGKIQYPIIPSKVVITEIKEDKRRTANAP